MNMKIRYLSYILGNKVPVYGNESAFLIVRPNKSLGKGDSCNTYEICMENHWGTHIDAPAHFFKAAKKVAEYPAKNWIFRNPCVINLNLKKEKIITLDKVASIVNKNHDILLLKTGFYHFRGKKIYSFDNPAVSPQIGLWLRKERPNIRAIGFDFISLGSCKYRMLAREAHRAFLAPSAGGKPIAIIEDMDLSYNLSALEMVIAAPLLISAIDSGPCTVFGIFKQ